MPSNYPTYLGLAVLLVIAPGPDFAVVTKNWLMYGRRSGLLTSLGVVTSLLVQGSAAAFGIAALIVRSQTAFNVMKIIGAIYLGYLGIQALRSALAGQYNEQPIDVEASNDDPKGPSAQHVRAYRQGFLSNITNPKVLVFYFSLLPQFVSSSRPPLPQVLLLAATHAFLALVWLLILVFVMERLQRLLRRPHVQRTMEGCTGIALLGFGFMLATAAP